MNVLLQIGNANASGYLTFNGTSPRRSTIRISIGSILTINPGNCPHNNASVQSNYQNAAAALRKGDLQATTDGHLTVVNPITSSVTETAVWVTGAMGSGWTKWKINDPYHPQNGQFIDVLRNASLAQTIVGVGAPPTIPIPAGLPSLLHPVYPAWIRHFPVNRHYIEVEASFWQPIFTKARQLRLWNIIFAGAPTARITRDRLLHSVYPTNEQKCAEILIWGYPMNQRGIPQKALNHLAQIAAHAPIAPNWHIYYANLNGVGGIGISTITKFAYFYSHLFGGMPSLILDQRLINNTALWAETTIPGLAYRNAHKHYLTYLKTMQNTSAAIGCTAEQLELFLFTTGANF